MKGNFFMTTPKLYKPTVLELQEAVKRAQENDPQATLQLYQWFKPLILSTAYSYIGSNGESSVELFEEDAINILWIRFYEIIKAYKGDNYNALPGLIKASLEHHLVDMLRTRKYVDPNADYDEEALNKILIDDSIEDIISDVNLSNAMKMLTAFQRTVIEYIYFKDYSVLETHKLLNKSLNKVWYAHKAAKKTLREYYKAVNRGDSLEI